MRPSKKGWINSYSKLLIERHEIENSKNGFDVGFEYLDHDKNLYKLLQPSGLMYGHPLQTPGDYKVNMKNWSDREKMKLILLDSFIHQSLLTNSEEIRSISDYVDFFQDSIQEIAHYYQENNFLKEKTRNLFQSKKNKNEVVESIIDQRIYVNSRWHRNFWAGFFQNSLLFLDVYYFGQWLQRKEIVSDLNSFNDQQEKLRLHILQIIAAAAYANDSIEEEEKALFNFFLHSARLSKENEQYATEFLQTKVSLENIPFDKNDPWLIRKYIFELAILTVWSDKKFEENEKEFVLLLAARLGFSDKRLRAASWR